MRVLKDGTIKYKKSALAAAEWMQQAPLPMRSFRKGTIVKAYCGGGWKKGKVIQWTKDGVTVRLQREQKTIVVRDNRNIREETSK